MSQKTKEKILSKSSLPSEGIASFIRKTYEILEDSKYYDIISWSEDGNFLVIKDVEEFCQKVLPVHFKHSNFTSFVRQLNIYNFHKKKTFNSQHVYYHELFKRGKVDLLKHIKRKNEGSSKGINITSTMIDKNNMRPDTMISQQANNLQIAQENLMLKQMNQKAIARINFLETKINEILAENRVLLKRISEKQENEENLKSVIYNYFQPNRQGLPIPSSTNNILPKMGREKVASAEIESYSRPPRESSGVSNEQVIISGSALTPETMPSDSPTHLMMGEQHQYITPSNSVMANTTNTQTSYDNSNYQMSNVSFNDEEYSMLGKRSAQQNENYLSKEGEANEGENKKVCNFENYKESDKERLNLMEVDFPLFPDENVMRENKYLASGDS